MRCLKFFIGSGESSKGWRLAFSIFVLLGISSSAHALRWPWDPNWEIHKDIPYGKSESERADLYLLRGSNHPAVIFIHGGAWSAGDKSGYEGYYAEKYAHAGFSVISINYRLAEMNKPETHWPAQLQDAQLAVRWVRAHAARFGIDPKRICAFGDSAGAHLALFLGTLKYALPGDRSQIHKEQSPSVRCVVDMFGPADLTYPDFTKLFRAPPVFGGKSFEDAPELWKAASPLFKMNSKTAPVMIIQGRKDHIVVNGMARELEKKLKELKVSHQYIEFNGGHWFEGLEPSSLKEQIDERALRFVQGVLRP